MKVTWVIERWIFDNSDNYQSELDFITEVKKQGHLVEVIDSSTGYDWRDRLYQLVNKNPYLEHNIGPVVFRGSLNVAREIHRSTSWIPGVYLGQANDGRLTNFNCFTYTTYWGDYLLNCNYLMLPLQEFHRRKKDKGSKGKWFIRPDSGMKPFAGQVVDLSDLSILEGLHPETLILSAYVKQVDKEWRFVVCDRNVITGCQYMQEGKYTNQSNPEELARVQEWLSKVLTKVSWQPDLIYTIDVCESKEELFVLELNSFSCSNFYNCDLSKMVEAANRVAISDWKEAYE